MSVGFTLGTHVAAVIGFWLVNLAAACRGLPLLLPYRIINVVPQGAAISQAVFGLSGLIAILAAACLGDVYTRSCLSADHA